MSHERRQDRQAYRRAAHEILVELREGKSVAWITQGDPLLYSTFLYVYQQVRSNHSEVRTEIVPGITSLQAAAACAGVPVAHLDEKVAIVPAAYGIENLSVLLGQFATVFLVKIHRVRDRLFEQLARLPVPVAAWYVEQVGTLEERVVTDVSTLRGQTLPYFSLVILRQEKPAGNEATGVEAS
jgi:precorrin-2/cobalt-factor-2 C20-methyltransferase